MTAAALDNTGKIYLTGSNANQALLDVSGSAGFGRSGSALHDRAAVSTSGSLVNDGRVYLDPGGGDGGSSLTLAGALTNSGTLAIGNKALSASDRVTAASLSDTGAINVTGSSASQALLDVNGLASIGAGASLGLDNHAAVSTTGSLVNDGHLRLDLLPGDGGSSLTVGGTLTNNDALNIGNAALSASDKVTAAALDNTNAILLRGSSANQALLDVTGGAGFGAAES